MSDDGTSSKDGDGAGNSGFKVIDSQDELNRIIGERVKRAEAKFPDYEAMKAKVAAFDKGAEADKTELQKMTSRAEVAEKLVGGFQQRDQVTKWADDAVKGSNIPASALRGSTEDEIKAHFEQIKVIAAPPAQQTRRTAVPAGRSDKDTGGSPAAALLRQYRQSAH